MCFVASKYIKKSRNAWLEMVEVEIEEGNKLITLFTMGNVVRWRKAKKAIKEFGHLEMVDCPYINCTK